MDQGELVLDLNEVRNLAVDAFSKHRAAISDRKRMKADFIRKNPDMNNSDRQIMFNSKPIVKECVEDEQMYGRWALLYSNMVIMESLLTEQEADSEDQ